MKIETNTREDFEKQNVFLDESNKTGPGLVLCIQADQQVSFKSSSCLYLGWALTIFLTFIFLVSSKL